MRSTTHRLLAVECAIATVGMLVATGKMPRHEASETLRSLANELAAIRNSLVEFTTRAARNAIPATHSED